MKASGKNQSPVRISLAGHRYGRLRVLSFDGLYLCGNNERQFKWKCICNCGTEVSVPASSLKRGLTKSCGCLKKESRLRTIARRGRSSARGVSPEYSTWASILARCKSNANQKSRKCYFNRGIKVCKRWEKFKRFLKDVGKRPKKYIFMRIDTSKGFSPSNCKWGSPNGRITRKSSFYLYKGVRRTIFQLSKISGLSYDVIISRILRGWSIVKTVETKKRPK